MADDLFLSILILRLLGGFADFNDVTRRVSLLFRFGWLNGLLFLYLMGLCLH